LDAKESIGGWTAPDLSIFALLADTALEGPRNSEMASIRVSVVGICIALTFGKREFKGSGCPVISFSCPTY
jgi:hypothetical protein